jgi:hypothetical protein
LIGALCASILSGDHWKVEFSGEYWKRSDIVTLQHVDTGKYLQMNKRQYGHPIPGKSPVHSFLRVFMHSSHRHSNKDIFHGIRHFKQKTNNSKYGVAGQLEVACTDEKNEQTQWRTEEGIYFPAKLS